MVDPLFVAIVVSAGGVLIIILRKLGIVNEYIAEPIEWFVIATAPLIPALLLLTKENASWFIVAYICIIVAWGIVSLFNKKITREKSYEPKEDEQKRKQARPVIIAFFGMMILFVILTYLRTVGIIDL